ncbi:hypothetical protein HAX54_030450, partial [Datura stramonium]|nr:hypothetical protein [Datura stramonium]
METYMAHWSKPTEHKPESSKGFSFSGYCIRTRNKVTCCHFSSDGKLLASAGHEKKTACLNMDALQTETITPEEHQYLITDIRFRPNSSNFVTASFDKSVRLWDAANPSYCLHAYTGHSSHVMSLDFHPKKNPPILQGRQCAGEASANDWTPHGCCPDKVGHPGVVNYLCWDVNGELLASSLELWDMVENKSMTVPAHENIIAVLALGPHPQLRASKKWAAVPRNKVHQQPCAQ